ncbi:bifunctional methylenetetrahydrofolate dehydrogenase/cyclohydrolase 2, mitochondrial [Ranitomeya imitator]|uniref:bifunctional methylenetetrahydrofolate dehydrogenase/cyclohydrolase 2, mitochondrial n=1 Tax=Ranitomeya imitator TaxID=111125 RepID=UPI0037E76918
MPEFIHLSSVFEDGMKVIGDRLDSGFTQMNTLFQKVQRRLNRLEADLQRLDVQYPKQSKQQTYPSCDVGNFHCSPQRVITLGVQRVVGSTALLDFNDGLLPVVMTTSSPSCSSSFFFTSHSKDHLPVVQLQTFYRSKAHIISGSVLAKEIKNEVQKEVESWLSLGNKRPHLSVILVGDNPASHTYVKNKIKAATTVGISSEVILRPSNVPQEELLDVINNLSDDSNVSGLLVQLPLPEHINERDVCNAIAPEKDVDGFHIVNIGRLCLDQSSIIPATAAAVWEIIKRTGIKTFGKNVVVAGRSKNVGMPISMLLHTDGKHERPGGDATVTITHRYTPKDLLKIHTQIADIIIVAAGIPKLITADMVKDGAAVIDVGINYVEDPITGKTILVGDVDFEEVKEKAGYITPVPGGVGPMTVAMLLKNTLMAAKKLIY